MKVVENVHVVVVGVFEGEVYCAQSAGCTCSYPDLE